MFTIHIFWTDLKGMFTIHIFWTDLLHLWIYLYLFATKTGCLCNFNKIYFNIHFVCYFRWTQEEVKVASLTRTEKHSFKWPTLQIWQSPIHNGTLKILSDQVWIGFAFLTYLHLWFLCKRDLHISCLSKTIEKFKEINTFQVINTTVHSHFLSD